MANTLTARLAITLTAALANDNALAPATASLSYPYTYSWADGTAINTANRIYAARLTLSTTPTDIDLAGSLADPLGGTVTFAKVVGLIVKNRSTTAAEIVTVGGDAAAFLFTSAANDSIPVGPDGLLMAVNPSLAGYPVTGTTADILQLVAATGTPSVDLIVIGRSA